MDKLQIYLGEDLIISDLLTVHQPNIIDIAEFGESHYFHIIYTLCAIPSDIKSELWDMGYNYCKMSEFDCFILLTRYIDTKDTKLIFGDTFSLKNMKPIKDPVTEETVLLDEEQGIVIDEYIYTQIVDYLRAAHGIKCKRERAANKETFDILITEDRNKKAKRKQEPEQGSILLPLISSMVNSPGFKYDIDSLKKLGIYAFMDSVQRIQAINTATSLSNGMYSGMVDFSKNKGLNKQLNWLRDLSEDEHSSNVSIS